MKKKLIIIDISSFIFRAFYAIRPLHSPSGVPVNAVQGVLSMLLKLFEGHRPTHVIVARDSKGPSFRHDIDPQYKANRSEPPEELIPQFDLVAKLLTEMELAQLQRERYEADDLIGSVCIQWADHFDEILIASSDKDLMQFVNEKIKIVDTMKEKIYDSQGVFDKMGVWPGQMVDYLSMLGDSSDNIPGMKGIGAKGASQLLAKYQTLDNAIDHASEFTNKRIQNAFSHHLDDAHRSRELVTIPTDLEITCSPDDTLFDLQPSQSLLCFLKDELGFKTLTKKIEQIKQKQSPPPYTLVTEEGFDSLLAQIKKEKIISLEACFAKDRPFGELMSMAISFDGQKAFYLPSGHQAQSVVQEVFSHPKKSVLGCHLKKLMGWCFFHGHEVRCEYDDVVVAHYVTGGQPLPDTAPLVYNKDKEGEQDELKETACLRAMQNFELLQQAKEELKEKGLSKVYTEIEKPLTPLLAKMESTRRSPEQKLPGRSGKRILSKTLRHSKRN